MAVVKYLFGFLLGFLGGAATMLWLLQSGSGDLVIRRTEVVQDLERRLREMELQRDALGRQLEDVLARSGRMERAFEELERRFQRLTDRAESAVTRPMDPSPVPPNPPVPSPRAAGEGSPPEGEPGP